MRFLFQTLFFCTLSLILLIPRAHAIEASGEGVNQRQAINNALRQAVEMSLGTEIESNTLVENFQVARQQILSHTRGFVRSYHILSEDKTSQGTVKVTIEAQVDENALEDSQKALATLMKMAAHPRVLVAALDEDFDALPSLSDEFRTLSESVEATLRDDFRFEVLDSEVIRLQDKNAYRFTDRKNNLRRAQRAKADYIIFVELLKGQRTPYTLRLESVEVASARSIEKRETDFAMSDWTGDMQNTAQGVIAQANDHIYGPSAQIAASLVKNIRKEVYEEGQRYELHFARFDEKLIQYLETDLTNLSGYVRHKIGQKEKNALSLSYWSLLKPGALNDQISTLLKGQEIPFDFSVKGRQISYRFDDPMFE